MNTIVLKQTWNSSSVPNIGDMLSHSISNQGWKRYALTHSCSSIIIDNNFLLLSVITRPSHVLNIVGSGTLAHPSQAPKRGPYKSFGTSHLVVAASKIITVPASQLARPDKWCQAMPSMHPYQAHIGNSHAEEHDQHDPIVIMHDTAHKTCPAKSLTFKSCFNCKSSDCIEFQIIGWLRYASLWWLVFMLCVILVIPVILSSVVFPFPLLVTSGLAGWSQAQSLWVIVTTVTVNNHLNIRNCGWCTLFSDWFEYNQW